MTAEERLTVSADGEFAITKFVRDEKWHWSWIAATAAAGVTVEGTRGYTTRAGALTAAWAARRRMIDFCRGK